MNATEGEHDCVYVYGMSGLIFKCPVVSRSCNYIGSGVGVTHVRFKGAGLEMCLTGTCLELATEEEWLKQQQEIAADDVIEKIMIAGPKKLQK